MGAMALRLGVRLGKPGVYMLNATGREAHTTDVHRAVALCGRAVWQGALLLTLGMLAWPAAQAVWP